MIPYQFPLLVWVPVSALLMLDRNTARAFSIAVVVGMLILPAKEGIEIVGLPDLDKSNVTALGVFVGTLIFHPNLIIRFRPRASDALLLLLLAFAVVTSVTNGFGVYDGVSSARTQIFDFLLPLFLARIHLNTPKALLTFLTALVIGGAIYVIPALWEFRMSPQIHKTLYGYFQHSFIQFKRGDFYRPVVCFGHALPLGRFFAFLAFLALLPLRSYFARSFRGGQWLFLAPLLGLLLSMSWGPYAMFAFLCGAYYVGRWRVAPIYAVPLLAAVWLILVLAGTRPLYRLTETVASISPKRADSLEYRLVALEEYRVAILQRPLFGHGGWGNARTERATDSAFLINSLARGLAGSLVLYVWWLWALHVSLRLFRRYRETAFGGVALSAGLLIAIGLAISAIDDALDSHVVLLAGSILALDLAMQGQSVAPGARAAAQPQSVGYVYTYD